MAAFLGSNRFKTLTPYIRLSRFHYYNSELGFVSSQPISPSVQNGTQNRVGIFWDLDNKPPKSVPPYDAAVKLKIGASSFGLVRYMVAYANRHAFSYVPPDIREQRKNRKLLDQLENKGVIKPAEPYLCRVCGRKFYTNEKLLNHFKQIHEREQMKRLNQIESARGTRKVKLVAKFSMKMEKYKNVARNVLTPKGGVGLADELKRAGFWVSSVSNKPQAADVALRDHMVDMMDNRRVECLVLVSDDSDFVDVLKEAKLRCVKTVVVGDLNDGALKRVADAGFSWAEIIRGKAKKEAVSVVGKWKDRDVLKRLEWRYDPEMERRECSSDKESEDSDIEGSLCEDGDLMQVKDGGACWKLDDDSETRSVARRT